MLSYSIHVRNYDAEVCLMNAFGQTSISLQSSKPTLELFHPNFDMNWRIEWSFALWLFLSLNFSLDNIFIGVALKCRVNHQFKYVDLNIGCWGIKFSIFDYFSLYRYVASKCRVNHPLNYVDLYIGCWVLNFSIFDHFSLYVASKCRVNHPHSTLT